MTCLIHFLVMKLDNLRCCRLLNESAIVCRAEITTPLATFSVFIWCILYAGILGTDAGNRRQDYIQTKHINTNPVIQVSAATQCKQLYDEVSRMWSMLDAGALRPSKACAYLGVVGLAGV